MKEKTSRNNSKETHLSICVMFGLRSFGIFKEFSPKIIYSISKFFLVLFFPIQLYINLSPRICEKQIKLMKRWFGATYFAPFLSLRTSEVRVYTLQELPICVHLHTFLGTLKNDFRLTGFGSTKQIYEKLREYDENSSILLGSSYRAK